MAHTSRTNLFGGFCSLTTVIALLAACGGGSGSDGTSVSASPSPEDDCGSDCGIVYVAITDADGDFLSYEVDVLSLSLERADGAVVQTLPTTTRVDFAEYVDLTEFVTAATIPSGLYVGAAMTLDYSEAGINVERGGEGVAADFADAMSLALDGSRRVLALHAYGRSDDGDARMSAVRVAVRLD